MGMELAFTKNMKAKIKIDYATDLNDAFGIEAGQPISFDHVLALVLFYQCTELRTAFSNTCRMLKDESKEDLKKRHSLFANMGRLLYEVHLFYASGLEYHTPLYVAFEKEVMFENLNCQIHEPTLATTDEAIAQGLAPVGIVLKLKKISSGRVFTMPMELFGSSPKECKHLIVDIDACIVDIWMAESKKWIGDGIMQLLLLDLLINNEVVKDSDLIATKNQKGAVQILKHVANGTISSYTEHTYLHALIESVMKMNDEIQFNRHNEQKLDSVERLIPELVDMFNGKDEESPFKVVMGLDSVILSKLK